MAGLVPATPIMWHGRAPLSGSPGQDPAAMTVGIEFLGPQRQRRMGGNIMRNSQMSRAFRWPAATLACTLLAAMLALAPTASRAQDTGEEWKVDPLRGPVDLGPHRSLADRRDRRPCACRSRCAGDERRDPRDRRRRSRQPRQGARHARLRVQDPPGRRLGGRRLSHAQARRAGLRGVRPHGLELRDRRHQRRRAGALQPDQGRLGPHLRDADPQLDHRHHPPRQHGPRQPRQDAAVDADDAGRDAALHRGVEERRAACRR